MLELFPFQLQASAQIADRFVAYIDNPVTRGRAKNQHDVPFYQALSSITGSGKTAMLADAVGQISALLSPAPIVLWLSKGRVVVAQSYANLAGGGKYNHLLGDSTVRLLSEYRQDDVAQASGASVYFATVGTFNQRDREQSNLKVFKSDIDNTETSIWEALRRRETAKGVTRPLVIVYDEAQNLSDQQTDLLLELEPAGILLASATISFPERFRFEVIDPLRQAGLVDADLVTSISSSVVVESGLVKSTISLDGLNSPMQETVATMLEDLGSAEAAARNQGLPFLPKAIYVCNTNMIEGDDQVADDPKRPFAQRQAPPITIWRYLVEEAGVPASAVAVYADLKTHKDFPLPDEFNLFAGGESDYEVFTAGGFRHVIFNLALQEGWDDPETYFAYIDKSMNSRVQVTQVVGRVLRQPGATHYPDEQLNTARFYVRLDRNAVFSEVVEDVRAGLGGNAPEIRLVATAPGKERPELIPTREARTVPKVAIDNVAAKPAVAAAVDKLNDFSEDSVNTRASGSRRTVVQRVGSNEGTDTEWQKFEHSSSISVRWLFRREISRSFRPALTVVNSNGKKFDAKVGMGSGAYAHVLDVASDVVSEFLNHAIIKQQRPNPYHVGDILVRRSEMKTFANALHDGYDGLTTLETAFAQALDELGLPWCRNPSLTGYKIPLLSPGSTESFFPDFLMWNGDKVFGLETKGEHLIQADAGRKLLNISPDPKSKGSIEVKLVSLGRWAADLTRTSPDGWTLWGINHNLGIYTDHFDEVKDLVASFR